MVIATLVTARVVPGHHDIVILIVVQGRQPKHPDEDPWPAQGPGLAVPAEEYGRRDRSKLGEGVGGGGAGECSRRLAPSHLSLVFQDRCTEMIARGGAIASSSWFDIIDKTSKRRWCLWIASSVVTALEEGRGGGGLLGVAPTLKQGTENIFAYNIGEVQS